ncbi:hypothetical protein [Streptantibioticus cattleyicolor]|uniref:hypothetical protein n=1 Tax=Streptantibioticus cattleyicolor TaxID=29303 RepID=UPI000213D1E9|nr:hypothetical protein [Streptantibioticus cattleyicolor]CCB72030.1 conserved protein of unknown function [Streptantibioticus cattleyicolor NRRL 8057 = DSM 46488]
MRRARAPSWQIRIASPTTLVTGLYVRDAAGLRPPRTGVDVPALAPEVPVLPGPAALATPRTAELWARWWHAALHAPDGAHPGFDAPELGALLSECGPAATEWTTARGREHAHAVTHGERRGAEGRFARGVAVQLGRAMRPFDLHVILLPLAGAFALRYAAARVLVSHALRDDAAAYERWLVPVIEELA